ncbi:MAG: tripartite tricarboxylate transporter substrate binding protein [Betaproteobacteria bacterium]|nr:MAG: tripartite tricarboxylate transporter substrate binding protein [Betaproteobacteria bacterium]
MFRLAARITVGLLVLAAAAPFAQAQEYPSKPVRILIPWPPGGSNDIVGRLVAQKLTEITRQQFVVDNRGGASGTIGSELVARADPDGYTIMIHSATHVANPHLFKKLPYDTLNDFVGITPLARQVGVLVVHPSLPVKSLKEFISLARARPGQIVYASSGNGSYVHLAMALVGSMSKVKMTHVPYKGGGPAAISIVSGETQAMLATIGSVMTQIKGGKLRPLAVTSEDRVKQLPQLPTIAEAGVPGYEFTAWIGAFAPARTPAAIVKKLNADFGKALADPGVAEKLSGQTLDPMTMSPEQFAKRLKSDYDKYGRLMKETGARID